MKNLSKMLPACGFVIAVALVLTSSAFTKVSNQKIDDLYSFQYVEPSGSNPYSQANVQNKSNWEYAPSDPGCTTGNVKPCEIQVSSSYVQGSDPSTYALDPSFSITASSGTTSHVTATSDGTGNMYITNRSNL